MFRFKKVASVIASAAMMSSTVALAAAANVFPAPFVQNGNANVAVVYGSNPQAAPSDLVAVTKIVESLQTSLNNQAVATTTTTTTTTGEGDSINLGTSSRKLYYGDAISAARASLSSSDLPNVLSDEKFVDLKGTEYSYTQTVKIGGRTVAFEKSGGDLKDPTVYLDLGTDAASPIYNYTVSFTKNLNVTDDTNVQGQKISLLGVDYVIGTSSTNTTLYLYGAGETATINGGESKTVTIAGKDHTVELASTSSATAAKVVVDGVSRSVTKGSSYSFAGDLNVYVKDITHPAYAGDIRSVDLIIGANTLKLANGQTVKTGADSTTIQGTQATIVAAAPGEISGFTVSVAASKSQLDSLTAGQSFSDPVFGGLKVQFAGVMPGLNDSARAKVVVDTDNNRAAKLTFTSAKAGETGEETITFGYDTDSSSSAVTPTLAYQSLSSAGRGRIHVLEGENALQDDWIVVNQGDNGGILKVSDLSVNTGDTTGTVTFSDAITGNEVAQITLQNSSSGYVKAGQTLLGGTGYTVSSNATAVNITWSAAGTRTLFPRIKLKDGGWVAILASTTLANASTVILPDGLTNLANTGVSLVSSPAYTVSNGVNWTTTNTTATTVTINGLYAGSACNFNSTKGPAILYLEPKKWDDGSYGDFICVPLSTSSGSNPEISIGTAVLSGTNSGLVSFDSDTDMQAEIDEYGTYLVREDRTNENGKVSLMIPASQMYADVLFTSSAVSISPGEGTTELGTVIFKDSEVETVSSKNLIVVGGSCINTVAAKLLGSSTPLCGDAWKAATNVGDGSFLIQTFDSPFTTGKVATLVAGYNALDTTNAATTFRTQPNIEVTAGKKYVSTSATEVKLV